VRGAAATAAAIGALLRLGNVDLDGPAVELGTIERRNGLVGRLVLVKGDEAESTRTTCVAIADHDGFADLAVGAASTHTEAGPVGRQQTHHHNRYLLLFQIFSFSRLRARVGGRNPRPFPTGRAGR
jgi:hypothetical protein